MPRCLPQDLKAYGHDGDPIIPHLESRRKNLLPASLAAEGQSTAPYSLEKKERSFLRDLHVVSE